MSCAQIALSRLDHTCLGGCIDRGYITASIDQAPPTKTPSNGSIQNLLHNVSRLRLAKEKMEPLCPSPIKATTTAMLRLLIPVTAGLAKGSVM